ncbi:hypothetical protein BJ165DRAFT_1391905 [Panaeolus papilionaceus]|nr:hypothetical protein BJ165DRAFT_1391905 [Panaeolus papilionaceus]
MSNVEPGSPPPKEPATPKQPAKNRFFFLDTIDFLVEDELFRVPRLAFEGREGSPFADAAMIQAEGSNSDAGSPVHLPVSKVDFEALCHVLYRTIIPGHRQNVTKEEWKSVMKLASMWNMKDMRELARDELSAIIVEPTELIQAAREFKVADWFRRGSYELVTQRTSFHPVLVGLSIGLDTAARLLYIQSQRALNAWKLDSSQMVTILTTKDTGITVCCNKCGSTGGLCEVSEPPKYGDMWGTVPAQARFRLEYPDKTKDKSLSKGKKKLGAAASFSEPPVVPGRDLTADKMINEEFAEELKLIEEAEASYEGSE